MQSSRSKAQGTGVREQAEARVLDAAALSAPLLAASLQEMIGDDTHARTARAIHETVLAIGSAASVALSLMATALSMRLAIHVDNAHRRLERLLNSPALGLDRRGFSYVRFVIGPRTEALIAFDWTDFAHDGHTTLCAYLVTDHGRATPLWWKTVRQSDLTPEERNQIEDDILLGLRSAIGPNVRVRLLCDRGFIDAERIEFWIKWGWGYVIRIRKNTLIADATGKSKRADRWLRGDGRAMRLVGATFTRSRQPIGSFVAVKQAGMKEPWLLICDAEVENALEAIALYGRRFSTEETFRDQQDPRFGLGLDELHVSDPQRRDRLMMLAAFTQVLLTCLGAAGEACGMDRRLHPKGGASQGKKRIYSLFRQGCMWFMLLPTMPEDRRRMLLDAFEQILRQHQLDIDLIDII